MEVRSLIEKNITERSIDIVAPVWHDALQFHTGGVIQFWGPMESSKTRSMLAVVKELILTQGFKTDRIFCNCWTAFHGSHHLRNDELRAVLRRAFNTETGGGKWNKCIFLLMDADDIYSHVTQADGECYQDIKKASQAYKRNMYLFYEIHEGLGVPKYLRDKTEIAIRPVVNNMTDHCDLYVADGHYQVNYVLPFDGISQVNDWYRRFDENY